MKKKTNGCQSHAIYDKSFDGPINAVNGDIIAIVDAAIFRRIQNQNPKISSEKIDSCSVNPNAEKNSCNFRYDSRLSKSICFFSSNPSRHVLHNKFVPFCRRQEHAYAYAFESSIVMCIVFGILL